MNLCGGDHNQIFDLESAARKIPASAVKASGFQCGGGCVRMDEDELFSATNHLSAIATDSSEDEADQRQDEAMNEISAKLPATSALDSIQQTLEDISSDSKTAISAITVAPITAFARSNKLAQSADTYPASGRRAKFTGHPSPTLLNPIHTEWLDAMDEEKFSTKLLCPIPDVSSMSPTLEALMRRLEEGFRVRLTGGPISCLAGEDSVCLYLHEDRSRLCFESDSHAKGFPWSNEVKDEGFCWIELPVADILRLEIGGNNRSPKTFSIVLEKEKGCLVYYDFETASAIDREVVVSTLILLLDKTHNTQTENDDAFDWAGGTMDMPIPCSPSLGDPLEFSSSLEQPIVCSPSLEQDRFRLSPRRRTQIFNSTDNTETETSLVIHLEDVSMSESHVSRRPGDWSRRDLPSSSFQQKSTASEEPEEVRLDFKPSASSTQLNICANNSTNIASTAWCSADSCALALNDIADTCIGIFALKQNDSMCAPPMGKEQRVVIEKFIASALGAPTAMYTYLAEGDIWNIETSVSNQDQKVPTVTRNRASILNAQAVRLRGLRNEMTFAAALKQSKERMRFVQTVQSFDDVYTRASGTKKLRAATEAANRFHSSPLLSSIVGSMMMHDPDGHSKEEEIAYYDSDPEDARPSTTKRGPRQVAAARQNEASETRGGYHHRALSGVGFEEIGTNKRVSRKIDEEAIVEIVQVSSFHST
jgi:hypothetical protein